MFVDSVIVKVKAGKGGDGAVAFRREKYVAMGGPSGGKGGRGGDVIFVGNGGLTTLLDFQFRKHIAATNGQNGMIKDMFGANGDDVFIQVPIGTTIIDASDGHIIGDITTHKQEVIVCKGGKGGRGNAFFATSKRTAPDFAEKGLLGEERELQLELKVLADVGLVGFPSVGKSTLLSVVSAAQPKIADYHFTTLKPQLGVVRVPDGRSFVMADLPGLIEGAHLGAGLGIQFLKHIERTRVIVHIIDMSSTDGRDPLEDFHKINSELDQYNLNILKRRQIIVANKMDMPAANENLARFINETGHDVVPISAISQQNLDTLLYKIADVLDLTRLDAPLEGFKEEVVEYNFEEPGEPFSIELLPSGIYNVTGPKIKKLFDRTDFNNYTSTRFFAKKVRELGVENALKELGVKNGDTVRIFNYEFEFTD